MARSPLTLAAAATTALPRTAVTAVGAFTEGSSGRYDSAWLGLDDGSEVIVRVGVDEEADAQLRAGSRALGALTAGVRGVLGFSAPDIVGETVFEGRYLLVQSPLKGYRVDAAEVPPGRGVGPALATAIARVHDLPATVVRDAGLPMHTSAQVRDEAERLLDRAEATDRLPFALLRRWSIALAEESLWRFETTVTLGGIDPASFVLRDGAEDLPEVIGLLDWHGLGVGDPALDLRWTHSAPAAHADILSAYAHASHRAPDAALAARARLHAELEFASWLVHGHATGDEGIIADALALLATLEETVRDEPPIGSASASLDETFAAAAAGIASGTGPLPDTSMQTDTFDAESFAAFASDDATGVEQETAPLDLGSWGLESDAGLDSEVSDTDADGVTDAAAAPTEPADAPARATEQAPSGDDPEAAARNALRRWTGSD